MVKKHKVPEFSPEELEIALKRDSEAFAQLIYDIWIEKKSIQTKKDIKT